MLLLSDEASPPWKKSQVDARNKTQFIFHSSGQYSQNYKLFAKSNTGSVKCLMKIPHRSQLSRSHWIFFDSISGNLFGSV